MSRTFTAIDGTVIVVDKITSVGLVRDDDAYADSRLYYVVSYIGGSNSVIGDNLKHPRSRMESDRRDLLEAISA